MTNPTIGVVNGIPKVAECSTHVHKQLRRLSRGKDSNFAIQLPQVMQPLN